MRGPCHLVVVIVAFLGGCTDGPSVKPPGTDDTLDESDTPGGGAREVRYGDLVITEFLVSSLQCPGQPGQFVEIYNATTFDIDLADIQIGNGETSVPFLSGVIRSGATVVGGPEASDSCGATPMAFTYEDLLFSVDTGRIELWQGAILIDGVDFHTWVIEDGVSYEVDPESLDADENDDGAAWCPATQPVAGSLDFGTPGAMNPTCTPPVPVALTAVSVGDLVISELMTDSQQCDDVTGQFIEIANTSSNSIDLTGLQISDGVTNVMLPPGMILERGGVAWFSSGTTDTYCYRSSHVVDGVWGSDLTFDDKEVVSIGSGVPFRALDSVPTRDFAHQPGVSAALSSDQINVIYNDDPAAWCFSGAQAPGQSDFASPGVANGSCSGAGSVVKPQLLGSDLREGDLVITEQMPNPFNCPDHDAEYFEVYNTLDEDIDLVGLRITINGLTVQLTIPNQYLVAPQSYALAEFYSGATVAGCYTGLVNDFLWNTGQMPNEGSTIRLSSDFYVVDEVDLTDLGTVPGAALQLDSRFISASGNDDRSRWCHATRTFPGSHGDMGSPKGANDPCPDPPPDTDTDTDTDVEVVPLPTSVLTLAAGDIVISEFIADPQDCGDFAAEFIELYNNTDLEVDLTGLLVNIGGNVSAVNTVLETLPPRGYGTLRYSSGAAPGCYGFTANARYAAGLIPDTGTAITVSTGRVNLDMVVSNGWTNLVPGRAMTLDPASLDATLNDDPAAWCQASGPFVGSIQDWGSPGLPNDTCPVVVVPVDTGDTDTVVAPTLTLSSLSDGDLIISEFMPNPEDCSDFAAEYVEIYNRREAPVDLTGLVVTVGGTNATLSSVGDPVPAYGYAVLRYTTGAPPACYGTPYAGVYVMAPRMPDAGTTLAIAGGGHRFDTVYATGWGAIQAGASMELDTFWLDAANNDDATHWCVATATFPGSLSDLGSPGEENSACTVAPLITLLDPSTPGLPIVNGVVGPFLTP